MIFGSNGNLIWVKFDVVGTACAPEKLSFYTQNSDMFCLTLNSKSIFCCCKNREYFGLLQHIPVHQLAGFDELAYSTSLAGFVSGTHDSAAKEVTSALSISPLCPDQLVNIYRIGFSAGGYANPSPHPKIAKCPKVTIEVQKTHL